MWWKLANAISPILLRENYMEQLSTFNIYISLSRETYCAISGHPTTLPIQSYWHPLVSSSFLHYSIQLPHCWAHWALWPPWGMPSSLSHASSRACCFLLISYSMLTSCSVVSSHSPSSISVNWLNGLSRIVPIALTWSGVSLSHSHHLPGLTTSPGFDFIRSCLPSRFVNANLKPQRASVSDRVCSTKRSSPFLLNSGCSFCWRTKTISPVTWLYPDAKHQTYSFSQWCSK